MHEEIIAREKRLHQLTQEEFVTRAVLMALYHDVPEGMTGDVITPVKETIAHEWDYRTWQQVEKKLGEETVMRLLRGSDTLRGAISSLGLLQEEEEPPVYSVASMCRSCDRLALIVECVMEQKAGGLPGDMAVAYHRNLNELQNSEWHHIRELAAAVSAEHPG
jgi:5'-deoxynucleotidase YfbR-like HD superfamily hydrolase